MTLEKDFALETMDIKISKITFNHTDNWRMFRGAFKGLAFHKGNEYNFRLSFGLDDSNEPKATIWLNNQLALYKKFDSIKEYFSEIFSFMNHDRFFTFYDSDDFEDNLKTVSTYMQDYFVNSTMDIYVNPSKYQYVDISGYYVSICKNKKFPSYFIMRGESGVEKYAWCLNEKEVVCEERVINFILQCIFEGFHRKSFEEFELISNKYTHYDIFEEMHGIGGIPLLAILYNFPENYRDDYKIGEEVYREGVKVLKGVSTDIENPSQYYVEEMNKIIPLLRYKLREEFYKIINNKEGILLKECFKLDK